MSYIGNGPVVGAFKKCDAITTSSTATYNLTVSSVAVIPQSANHCIVSLNGVIQAPTSAFTVSGSTIVFNSSLTSSDVVDFILILGDVLNVGTPSDDAVSTAKIADDAVTLAKMAAGTDGQIITYDASGNPAAVGPGSDGQVLTSTGAGSPPAFEAVSAGLNLLLTTTASSSSLVEFTNTYLTTTYDAYLIKLTNVHVSADASIYVQFKVGGSYLTSGYYYVCWRINAENAATGNANGSTGASQIRIDQESVGADTGENINYSIWLNDPAGTDNYKTIDYTGSGHNGTPDLSALSGVGDHQGAVTALDAIKIYPSTGNFASGVFSLYGVAK